ncbi:MAG: HAD-IA family hydrolase [candidate division Zixibacteria bacterium]|nr:HAD-IA family hydrolase [candidate division Zixibacteria bacterium]
MLDTVTFDLWNTLLNHKPEDYQKYGRMRVEKLRAVLKQDDREIESARLLDAYHKGFEKCKETWERNLDLSTEDQLQTVFDFVEDERLKGIPQNLMSHLVEAYVSPILEDPPDPIWGAHEILRQLKKKGYKVGLVCNTGTTPGSTIRVLLGRLEMINYFDVTTFSDQLGIRKPDPRIFLHTLARLRSRPQSSAHVGDLIHVDVWGARNVGMVSVHFNPDLIPCDDIIPDFAIRRLEELGWIFGDLK